MSADRIYKNVQLIQRVPTFLLAQSLSDQASIPGQTRADSCVNGPGSLTGPAGGKLNCVVTRDRGGTASHFSFYTF